MCAIGKRINDVRALIKLSLISEQNTDGFLMGDLDEYLKDIHPQITQMSTRID